MVLREFEKAPAERAQGLTDLIRQVNPARLVLSDESAALAKAYLQHQILTRNHLVDARHVAIASVCAA